MCQGYNYYTGGSSGELYGKKFYAQVLFLRIKREAIL
jgi:hypothetical protein